MFGPDLIVWAIATGLGMQALLGLLALLLVRKRSSAAKPKPSLDEIWEQHARELDEEGRRLDRDGKFVKASAFYNRAGVVRMVRAKLPPAEARWRGGPMEAFEDAN